MTIPKNFGRYEIIEVLGWSAMGDAVYKARDPLLDRLVALKVWSALEPVPEARRRWFSEMKRSCSICHSHIVAVYEAGELDGSPYLAMELVEGESLDSVIRTGRPLTLLQRLGIISQIAGALQFAHDHGVLHQDVKPGNIILLQDGNAKLGGLEAPYFELMNLESPRPRMGTVVYMAPEVINGEAVDGRAAVFSLGCTFYEFLEGRKPFEADSITQVILKILRDPPSQSQKARDLDLPELQRIFDKALAKPKDSRYQSCAELRQDLERLRKRIELRV